MPYSSSADAFTSLSSPGCSEASLTHPTFGTVVDVFVVLSTLDTTLEDIPCATTLGEERLMDLALVVILVDGSVVETRIFFTEIDRAIGLFFDEIWERMVRSAVFCLPPLFNERDAFRFGPLDIKAVKKAENRLIFLCFLFDVVTSG